MYFDRFILPSIRLNVVCFFPDLIFLSFYVLVMFEMRERERERDRERERERKRERERERERGKGEITVMSSSAVANNVFRDYDKFQ